MPKATPAEAVRKLGEAQKKTLEKYGKKIKEELIRVEYWVEAYTPEESMQKFKEERESAHKIARELGAAVTR